MTGQTPFERFENIRALLGVAIANHASSVTSDDPLDLEFALRRYIEAVDGIITQLQGLDDDGALVDIAVFLAMQSNPGQPLQ